MKKVSLFMIFAFSILILKAQEEQSSKSSFRTGLGGVFFGSGDGMGLGLSIEYTYMLNDYFTLASRLMSAGSAGITDTPNSTDHFNHLSSVSFSVSSKMTPFPDKLKRLKFDIGLLYHRQTVTSGDLGTKEEESGAYNTSETKYLAENLYGFLGSVSYDVIDRKRVVGGVRFDLLTSLYEGYLENDAFQNSIYLGVKF